MRVSESTSCPFTILLRLTVGIGGGFTSLYTSSVVNIGLEESVEDSVDAHTFTYTQEGTHTQEDTHTQDVTPAHAQEAIETDTDTHIHTHILDPLMSSENKTNEEEGLYSISEYGTPNSWLSVCVCGVRSISILVVPLLCALTYTHTRTHTHTKLKDITKFMMLRLHTQTFTFLCIYKYLYICVYST
eukprot:GHVR01008423.1.p1 GENE.GHVR01008423.1~~GHVR01008423.1.p1  ORF type:complete len:187 (+),score=87.72 GHVR01008423.1:270-830(+)